MIRLYRCGDYWMADYSAAPAEQRATILDLFGCLDLPCAFTTSADPTRVLAEIRRLNPDREIVLAE